MGRKNYYGYGRRRRGCLIFWVFVGILAFCLIFFPFFGGNLAYQLKNVLSPIGQFGGSLTYGGIYLIVFGVCVTANNYIGTERKGKIGPKMIVIGFLLVIIGILLEHPLSLFSFGRKTLEGYH